MKKYVCFILAVMAVFSAFSCSAADISRLGSASEWAAADVNWANANELIGSGITTKFNENITRIEFAELIVALVEKECGSDYLYMADSGTFYDTDSPAVLKAAGSEIVKGTGNGLFNPYAPITRQEMAVMICRAIGFVESKNALILIGAHDLVIGETADVISHYDDYGDIAPWAEKQVNLLNAKSIMNGTSDTTISPLSYTTVEEAIILVSRVGKKVFYMAE